MFITNQNYKNLVILGMLPLSLDLGKLSPSDRIFSSLLQKPFQNP